MSSDPDRMTVYADYVCPFCYLGKQSLESYRERRSEPLAIDWRPFDLQSQKRGPDGEIDHSVDDGKDEEYYEQARENVRRLRERFGADEMLDPADSPDVDSLNAQVVSLAVKREHPEQWEDFDRALYEALWEAGRDIGDPAVLEEIAADVGLPEGTVEDALADEDLRTDLESAFDESRRAGVTGVPTFQYGEYVARGAVPPEQLQRLVEDE